MNILGGFVAAGNIEIAPARCTGTDEHGVPAFRQQRLHTVDAFARTEFDAEIENVAALLIDDGIRQTEFRDLRADHAAGFWATVENDAVISARCEIAGDGEGRRAAADECNALAIFPCRRLRQS